MQVLGREQTLPQRQWRFSIPIQVCLSPLKQLPDIIIEHAGSLELHFDAINTLIKAVLDVTKCVVDCKELSTQYISHETPPMSTAMALIPTATYWTIRSMVASASQITSLLGMSYDHLTSTTEAWELSSLAHKVGNIHGHLFEKRRAEMYEMLVCLFKMDQRDNMKILKALIYSKDDKLPLLDGSNKKRVNIDVLRRKTMLLLISDIDMFDKEVTILAHKTRTRAELNYESQMPWYTVAKPSLLEPVVIRYIKEAWHFSKKLMLVALDPQGKSCSGRKRLGALSYWWAALTPTYRNGEGNTFACMDIEWKRKFTATAKDVARTAGIAFEMVYIGKRFQKQVTRNITATITAEKLSSCLIHMVLLDPVGVHVSFLGKTRKTAKNDRICNELFTVLGFEATNKGWAITIKGSAEMARVDGETVLKSFDTWEEDVEARGFIPALDHKFYQFPTPQHCCNELILPGTNGAIPDNVVCHNVGIQWRSISCFAAAPMKRCSET
ncbi:hypothetical protein Acr_00g0065380 [Actinidia rufa]|uniref:Uncharacterized protein n=1 Tax=Actinidia rufa TaxID=165716 RepID=A0A7J0DQB5_9ERIC|nr:hypothetical protein Acr_00g0065380 [Actinidia rufa]